ncbi:hypothetical protein MTO96_010347 [Rhipicephalus appendiculatus]
MRSILEWDLRTRHSRVYYSACVPLVRAGVRNKGAKHGAASCASMQPCSIERSRWAARRDASPGRDESIGERRVARGGQPDTYTWSSRRSVFEKTKHAASKAEPYSWRR